MLGEVVLHQEVVYGHAFTHKKELAFCFRKMIFLLGNQRWVNEVVLKRKKPIMLNVAEAGNSRNGGTSAKASTSTNAKKQNTTPLRPATVIKATTANDL